MGAKLAALALTALVLSAGRPCSAHEVEVGENARLDSEKLRTFLDVELASSQSPSVTVVVGGKTSDEVVLEVRAGSAKWIRGMHLGDVAAADRERVVAVAAVELMRAGEPDVPTASRSEPASATPSTTGSKGSTTPMAPASAPSNSRPLSLELSMGVRRFTGSSALFVEPSLRIRVPIASEWLTAGLGARYLYSRAKDVLGQAVLHGLVGSVGLFVDRPVGQRVRLHVGPRLDVGAASLHGEANSAAVAASDRQAFGWLVLEGGGDWRLAPGIRWSAAVDVGGVSLAAKAQAEDRDAISVSGAVFGAHLGMTVP